MEVCLLHTARMKRFRSEECYGMHCTHAIHAMHSIYAIHAMHYTYAIHAMHCTYAIHAMHCTYEGDDSDKVCRNRHAMRGHCMPCTI